jgi:polysaccharide export outer membrane protein
MQQTNYRDTGMTILFQGIKNSALLLSRKQLLSASAWIISCLILSACAGSENRDSSVVTRMPAMPYTIGPSDVLSIAVRNHDDMNTTVTVRPDGMISFPLLDEIYVVGLTPAELQGSMAESLREYINILPRELSVVVDAVHSYTVSVLGEVRAPGRFEFQSRATVLDALAMAGGLTEFASRRNILILRPHDEGVQRIRFNYQDVARARENSTQMYLFPGDTVLVP